MPYKDQKSGGWYWIDRDILRLYGARIGVAGLGVYNVLAMFAGSETQVCFPSQNTVAKLLGISRRTVIRKIKLLGDLGLIEVEKRNGRCRYRLLRRRVSGAAQYGDRQVTAGVPVGNTKDNKRIRVVNNIDKGENSRSKPKAAENYRPKTREQALALDLARELDDLPGLPLYISFAKKYPEPFLRQIAGQVRDIPAGNIKKSRGALFNHLVRKNAGKPGSS